LRKPFSATAILSLTMIFGVSTQAATATIASSSKSIWAATVQAIGEHASVKTLDRDSGLIMTEPTTIDAGFNNRFMGSYVRSPKGLGGFLSTWNGLRVQITATVTEVDVGHSTVALTARYEAFEDNVSHKWVMLASNGSFEDTIMSEIQGKVRQQ
jgi:hypothetical protein